MFKNEFHFPYVHKRMTGVIKNFMLTQWRMKFIMLINVKMPTYVGILTFISMINTTSEFESKSFYFSTFVVFIMLINVKMPIMSRVD